MALVRKNIQMSPEIAKWYEDNAREMGVSQSNLMTIALKQYIDQQKTIELMYQLKEMMNELEEMKLKEKGE